VVGGEVIRLSDATAAAIRSHAEADYPDECCGGLLGRVSADGVREVARAAAVRNDRSDSRQRRYLIGPEVVRALELVGARDGLELIGFYHSHPDHPATPSVFDREHAWPWYTYVIVPVAQRTAGMPRAWRLREDREEFEEHRIGQLDPEEIGA
jgi:proteasome lid subunit RPN8/RPN11